MAETKSINALEVAKRLQAVQARVWRARALTRALREGLDGCGRFSDQIDDPEAAMEGLIEYLESLHNAMDSESLMFGANTTTVQP